jgi:hypothetical protein
MFQLGINMNSVFTQIKNVKQILIVFFLLITVAGCATPGALVPGQTELALKDMPLVIFTLQLSQFPIPARIDIVLRDNTTQERQYLQLWGNLTNKQHQQDYHNQIITLQLSPGTYTIKKSF